MNKIKRIFISVLALITMCVATLGLAGCGEDLVKIEVKISAYDTENSAMYSQDLTLTIDLYRHIAPKTVDKIIEYVNSQDKPYENAIFYKFSSENTNQLMVGDLKFENGVITQTAFNQIDGEFENNGQAKGSNLVNNDRAVGLWRSWYSTDSDKYENSSDARDSGRGTWYIPTSRISTYDKNFCIFGQIPQTEDNDKAIEAVKDILDKSTYYNEYFVFYVGEYDQTKPNENYGLTFNCVTRAEWEEIKDNQTYIHPTLGEQPIFKAEETVSTLVCYNPYVIRVPKDNGNYAKITSIKVI